MTEFKGILYLLKLLVLLLMFSQEFSLAFISSTRYKKVNDRNGMKVLSRCLVSHKLSIIL